MATAQTTHVLKEHCERCAELEHQLEQTQIAAEMDMASLGAQLAQMKRENDLLRSKLADRAKEMSKRDHELYLLWLEVHGKDPDKKVNGFGPAAQRALTRARKAGLEQDDMEKIIRTHARVPFLVFGRFEPKSRNPKDRKDHLADCFADERRWNQLLELADAPTPARSSHVPKLTRYGMTDPRIEADRPSLGFASPVSNVYAALERADCRPYLASSGQGSALCPIHDDREKSFRFKEDGKGGVLLYCQACASHFVSNEAFCEQVRQNLELPITDLYPQTRGVA